MTTLYHLTSTDAAAAILAGGFVDSPAASPGDSAGVWLSADLDPWGASSRVTALCVELDMPPDELAGYAVAAVADEEWDDAIGDFAPCPPDEVERFTWYCIPSARLAECAAVRELGADERRRIREVDESGLPRLRLAE